MDRLFLAIRKLSLAFKNIFSPEKTTACAFTNCFLSIGISDADVWTVCRIDAAITIRCRYNPPVPLLINSRDPLLRCHCRSWAEVLQLDHEENADETISTVPPPFEWWGILTEMATFRQLRSPKAEPRTRSAFHLTRFLLFAMELPLLADVKHCEESKQLQRPEVLNALVL